MNIHYLQHVPFEGPEQAQQKGHQLTGSLLYENGRLPSISEFDMLVIPAVRWGHMTKSAFHGWRTKRNESRSPSCGTSWCGAFASGRSCWRSRLGEEYAEIKSKRLAGFPSP